MRTLLSILIFFLFVGCSPFDKLSRRKMNDLKSKNLKAIYAFNNPQNCIAFFIYETNVFSRIDKPGCSNKGNKIYYTGSYISKSDSLIFKYDEGRRPQKLVPYLIRDSSFLYLTYKNQGSEIRFRIWFTSETSKLF